MSYWYWRIVDCSLRAVDASAGMSCFIVLYLVYLKCLDRRQAWGIDIKRKKILHINMAGNELVWNKTEQLYSTTNTLNVQYFTADPRGHTV